MLSNLRSRYAVPRRAVAVLCLGACLAVTSSSRPSLAQSDGETEVARQRFREGVAHYDRQDYEKARLAFLQAYLLKPHPAVLLNLAQSELRAGRHAEAAANFAKYLHENPNAPAMDHAKAGFDEARQRVTELNVQVNATAAAVLLDGNEVGQSPLPTALYLMPGRHSILARKANASAEKVLDAVAGRREYITLELQEGYVAGAATSGMTASVGTGQVGTEPGTDGGDRQGFFSWVGSSPAAVATVSVAALALGTSAVLAGFASNRYAAANDARSQIMGALEGHVQNGVVPPNTAPCGASGIASGMVEFGPGVPAEQQQTLVEQYGNACDLFNERSDEGDRLKTLSLVSLGVGAFAAIGTVVWYFADSGGSGSGSGSPSDDAIRVRRVALSPLLSPSAQGLQLKLDF